MRSRIRLTRVHQLNSKDWWKADCYINDHQLMTAGMTQQKALDKMYRRIEQTFKDKAMPNIDVILVTTPTAPPRPYVYDPLFRTMVVKEPVPWWKWWKK